ncbi:hypothetical protein [Pseudohongiella acticola]|jgi:uncharacterized NTF2-like protein DUF6841|uniref:DUF6841 family protein n=1 Tax=Pseudohongiella acticola TaxID=1524254 RepID=UPI0030EE5C64
MSMQKHNEIRQTINAIGSAFSELDFDAWLSHFCTPRTVISQGTVFSSSSIEDTREFMGPVFDSLRQRGFSHTRLDTCHVKLLGDTTAMVSTVWTRFGHGDTVIETLGATYLLVSINASWKVAVVTSHRADMLAIEAEG